MKPPAQWPVAINYRVISVTAGDTMSPLRDEMPPYAVQLECREGYSLERGARAPLGPPLGLPDTIWLGMREQPRVGDLFRVTVAAVTP